VGSRFGANDSALNTGSRVVFIKVMVNIQRSREFGRLEIDELEAFQRRLGVSLPTDYRTFLLDYNGGQPWPERIVTLKHGSTDVQYLYGIHAGPSWANLQCCLEDTKGRIVKEGLPVGNDSMGNLFVLILHGKKTGLVYFWNHELESAKPSYRNMEKVSDSFAQFIGSLRIPDSSGLSEAERIIVLNDLAGLEAMVDRGFDLETKDDYGRTILENAAIHNRTEMIQFLVSKGAQLRNALGLAEQNFEFFPDHEPTVRLLRKLARR
jgi:hypothetical protein